MSALGRIWPAGGPALLAVLLAIRTLGADGLEPTMGLGIAAAFAVVGVFAVRRSPLAAVALLIPPVAFVASPARTELSFNLSRPNDTGWYLFTLAIAVGAGLCVAASAVLLVDRPVVRWAALPLVVIGAAGFAALITLVDPQPDLGRTLDRPARDELASVIMVNYAYSPEPVTVIDGRLQLRLVNDSDLPHTLSVESLDVDVYVPAGRTTDIDVAVPAGVATLDVYCDVGDHVERGMVMRLEIR